MQCSRIVDFGRATASGQAARSLACRSSASAATDTATSTATATAADGGELRGHGAGAADMVVVNVDLGERSYPIYIGAGILDQGDLLRRSVIDNVPPNDNHH